MLPARVQAFPSQTPTSNALLDPAAKMSGSSKQKPGPSVPDEFSIADFKLKKNDKQQHGIARKLVDTFHKVEPNMYPSLAAQLARKLPKFMEITKENQLSSPKQHPLYSLMRGTGESKEKRVTYPSWFFLATVFGANHPELQAIRKDMSKLWGADFPKNNVTFPSVPYDDQRQCFNGKRSTAKAEPTKPSKTKSRSKTKSKAKSKSSALATKNTLSIETELQPTEASFVSTTASLFASVDGTPNDCSGTARMSAAEPVEQIRVAQIAIDKRHESKPDPETDNHTDEHEAVEHDESWDDSEEFEGFPFEPTELNEEELKTTKTPNDTPDAQFADLPFSVIKHQEEPETTMTPDAAPDVNFVVAPSSTVKHEEEPNTTETPDTAPYPHTTEIEKRLLALERQSQTDVIAAQAGQIAALKEKIAALEREQQPSVETAAVD
ncbi:hypothetical protein FDECE_4087 [Fusarium decemcellulare]|nr:hypothetical protein FDECE_4087 [Fusarium decemcellulare]